MLVSRPALSSPAPPSSKAKSLKRRERCSSSFNLDRAENIETVPWTHRWRERRWRVKGRSEAAASASIERFSDVRDEKGLSSVLMVEMRPMSITLWTLSVLVQCEVLEFATSTKSLNKVSRRTSNTGTNTEGVQLCTLREGLEEVVDTGLTVSALVLGCSNLKVRESGTDQGSDVDACVGSNVHVVLVVNHLQLLEAGEGQSASGKLLTRCLESHGQRSTTSLLFSGVISFQTRRTACWEAPGKICDQTSAGIKRIARRGPLLMGSATARDAIGGVLDIDNARAVGRIEKMVMLQSRQKIKLCLRRRSCSLWFERIRANLTRARCSPTTTSPPSGATTMSAKAKQHQICTSSYTLLQFNTCSILVAVLHQAS
ncbi:hypothetical protein KCU71_g42, partial [Aureobasidium melanogenum]